MSEMRLWDDNPTGVDLLGFAPSTAITTGHTFFNPMTRFLPRPPHRRRL